MSIRQQRADIPDQPFWSVMIPTYNPQPEYLEAALVSVLEQGIGTEQMQIEIVDDCSSDGAPERLARRIGGDRICVHRNLKNRGLAGAWNQCISRARGQWVHILHQDDLVLPGFYTRLGEAVKDKPEIGVAFCRHAWIDRNGNQKRTSDLERNEAGVLPGFEKRLAEALQIQCASVVIHRRIYEQVGGFSEKMHYTLDWDMWLRACLVSQVWYDPTVMACYRHHALSTTTSLQRNGEDVREIGRFLKAAEAYFGNGDCKHLLSVGRRRYAFRAIGTAEKFLAQGDWRGAINQVIAAWQLRPSFRLLVKTIRCSGRGLLQMFGRGRKACA